MNVLFDHIETLKRSYQGVNIDEQECRHHLQDAVRDNLQDREE
jgi:hypothetical protein